MPTVTRVPEYSVGRKCLAWGVHALTAFGAVCGMFAILAAMEHQWKPFFTWLFVATVIDGFDGMLARAVDVKKVLPGFDGALLDNIVDYLTYVVAPAVFVYVNELTPPPFAGAMAGAIIIASAYQFCQSNAKTDDHFFLGFPSYWNVVALYLFLLEMSPRTNLTILGALVLLVFVPAKYLYPSRASRFYVLTIVLTVVWGVSLLAMLVAYPGVDRRFVWLSLVYVIYYVALSISGAGGLRHWIRFRVRQS